MVNQQFFLEMIPDSAPVVVNIGQYDYDEGGYVGRLIFNLIAAGETYDMDGATAVFQGLKPDGTSFSYPANIISASVVRVPIHQQMTTVKGRVVCELVLTNTDGRIASFNIWLEVQQSALDGASASQTDIPSLIAIAQEAADRAEQAADNAEAWSEHPPYIGLNGHWFVYDTATDLYVDSGVDSRGINGNKWYTGTAVSGKSLTPTAFSTGIALAYVNDLYLNIAEGAVYHNTVEGDDTVALWVYDMTLSGGGGISVLSDLTDVSITTPANNQVLTYEGGVWKNKNASGGASALNDLTDVTITSALNGQYLKYDGSKWINAAGGGGGASALDDLTDVTITSATAGQILEYDGADWVNGENITNFARFGGSKTFAQLDASLLTAANVDKFYLCTDGGTISAGDAANWILPQGSVIPANSHIAVIEYTAGVYKFDDFGGYVDLSGLAEKTDLDVWTPSTTVSSGAFTFSGLDDTQGWGYKPFVNVTDASTNKNPTASISSMSGSGTASMSVSYTTTADEGATVYLRIIK